VELVGKNVSELASQMRATGVGPSDLARLDQSAADWTETFSIFGLDLRNPAVASAAYVVARILFERLSEPYGDPVEALHVLTGRIVEAVVAIGSFIS
jgi:hypothetical protein